jgi:hypothetical protein
MFFITAIHSQTVHCDQRTFGYHTTLHKAESSVKGNVGDMHESLYDFIVIEEIKCGIHSPVVQEWWYKWNHTRWELCEKPDQFIGIVNFAIG